jgi:hypothetical protein
MQGVRNGISIFLSTGYCVGTVVAMLLNSILPADTPVAYADEEDMEGVDAEGKVLEDEEADADPAKSKAVEDSPEEAAAPSSEEVDEEHA